MEGFPLPSYSSVVSSLPRLRGDGMDSDSLLPNTPLLLVGSSPPNPPPPRHRNLNSSSKAATIAKAQKPKHVPKEPTKGAVGHIKPRSSQEYSGGTSLKKLHSTAGDHYQMAGSSKHQQMFPAKPVGTVGTTGLVVVPQSQGYNNLLGTENNTGATHKSGRSSQLDGGGKSQPNRAEHISLSTNRIILAPNHAKSTNDRIVFAPSQGESTNKTVLAPSQESTKRLPHGSHMLSITGSSGDVVLSGNSISSSANRPVFTENQGVGQVPSGSSSNNHSNNHVPLGGFEGQTKEVPPTASSNSSSDVVQMDMSHMTQVKLGRLVLKDGDHTITGSKGVKKQGQDTVAISMVSQPPPPPPPTEEREVEGQSQSVSDVTLKSQVDALSRDLELQVKVNTDLKKLLVASVGDDLHWKMDALVQTKSQLASEIGGYTEKLRKDYEELDTLSIQADMWKSKFMATRVLMDQLSKDADKQLTKTQEAERALKHLMQERQELHSSMVETHRYLKFLRDSFDPVYALRSHSIVPNILELARTNQLLSEAIKTKLLGNSSLVTVALDAGIQNGLTPAEKMAYQVLMSDMHPSKQVPGRLSSQHLGHFGRFHPQVREEGFQWTCCRNCTGDVYVI